MKRRIMELARQYGVVGAGGAGFPTHVKLNTDVEYLVVNGAECEPLITVDQVLMLRYAKQLAKTLNELRYEMNAKMALIGIKAKHHEVVQTVEEAIKPYPGIRVIPLGDFYPAGDEYVLVYETTSRQIPQGGIPLECGVVVINVETLFNLGRAQNSQPVTQKWVTVAGNVAQPGTYQVPLGVSIGEMLTLAGGTTIAEYSVINGGPMMGKLVTDLDEPVTKTTKGLLVLPDESPVIVNHHRPLQHIIKQAQSICCQCRLCTDLCPRNLLGYEIQPNKTILSASYRWTVCGGDAGQEALLCSECGVCDLFACPMGLSPRRVNQALKGGLTRQKIPVPHKGAAVQVSEWRPYRRIPTKRLVNRLGLASYRSPVTLIECTYTPEKVVLPLRQHIGAPSEPIVQVGDHVECGQRIADIPHEALSSNLFASVSGIIAEITPEQISIQKVRDKG